MNTLLKNLNIRKYMVIYPTVKNFKTDNYDFTPSLSVVMDPLVMSKLSKFPVNGPHNESIIRFNLATLKSKRLQFCSGPP